MKNLFVTFSFLIVTHSLLAGADSVFVAANQAYERSEYGYAIELYHRVLNMGFESSELYYNLGNAYFKENKTGAAILNFERALRLDPGDEDINANLAFARTKTVDRMLERPKLFYENWWIAAYSLFTADNWAVVFILFLVLFLSTVSLYLFSQTSLLKKIAFYSGLSLLALVLLSGLFMQKQYNKLYSTDKAIIMAPRITAKSSPSPQSPDLFLMHEGTKVTVRNHLGDWTEIVLPNGNVGWIMTETIEII